MSRDCHLVRVFLRGRLCGHGQYLRARPRPAHGHSRVPTRRPRKSDREAGPHGRKRSALRRRSLRNVALEQHSTIAVVQRHADDLVLGDAPVESVHHTSPRSSGQPSGPAIAVSAVHPDAPRNVPTILREVI